MPDLDIYRSANILVKQHGEDAPIEAAMRTDLDLRYVLDQAIPLARSPESHVKFQSGH
jgi:hypothetical protein